MNHVFPSRPRVFAFCVVLISLLIPAFTQEKPAYPEKIRIVTLKGPTGMGMFQLMEKGYLELEDGHRIPLEIEAAGTPDLMDSRIIAGQADFFSLPVNQAAKLYAKGAKVQLAGVNVWGVLYLVSTEIQAGVANPWKALKGLTIYSTGKGASPDSVFRTIAEKQGLNPDSDFTLDYRYSQVQLAGLMIEKQVKTAFLPEPFASKVLAGLPEARIVIDMQKDWAEWFKGSRIAQGGLLVQKDFALQWPAVTRALMVAYKDSTLAANQASDAPERIAKLGLGIDAASFKAARQRMNLEFKDAQASRKDTDTYLKALFDHNPQDVGGILPDNAFYFQ